MVHDAFSSLQVQLYEDFAKSRAKASVEDSISNTSAEEEKPKLKATGHVFQVWILFKFSRSASCPDPIVKGALLFIEILCIFEGQRMNMVFFLVKYFKKPIYSTMFYFPLFNCNASHIHVIRYDLVPQQRFTGLKRKHH